MVGAEEEIIWIKRHFPPAFILEGDLAGQGIHDRTMEILQKGLPEYRHQIVTANHPRTKKMMETDANICRVGLFRNEARERTMHMSVAHILVSSSTDLHENYLVAIDPANSGEGMVIIVSRWSGSSEVDRI